MCTSTHWSLWSFLARLSCTYMNCFLGPTQMPPLPESLVWSPVPELLYFSTLVPDWGHSHCYPLNIQLFMTHTLKGRGLSYSIFVSATPPIMVFPDSILMDVGFLVGTLAVINYCGVSSINIYVLSLPGIRLTAGCQWGTHWWVRHESTLLRDSVVKVLKWF